MSDAEHHELSVLAKIVGLLAVVLFVAGVFEYGVGFVTIHRVLHQLAERPGGPMTFRFILQPAMALVAAIHDGHRDARSGRSHYLRAILLEPENRMGRLREGLNATARIILLGLVMDAIYQIIVLHRFYPAEAVIIALLLAFVPYVLLRGTVSRIERLWRSLRSASQV
jgi:hypothetical protein